MVQRKVQCEVRRQPRRNASGIKEWQLGDSSGVGQGHQSCEILEGLEHEQVSVLHAALYKWNRA